MMVPGRDGGLSMPEPEGPFEGVSEDDGEEVDLEYALKTSLVPKGAVLSGWVVVLEYLDPEGEGGGMMLATDNSEGMTPWLRSGMLNHALSIEGWDDKEEEGDDDA